MITQKKAKTLLTRELQEHHTAIIKTPLIIAALLVVVMLASVLLVNRVSIIGNTAMEVVMQEHASDAWITVTVDGGDLSELVVSEEIETAEDEALPDDWNFSKEWTFTPPGNPASSDVAEDYLEKGSLDGVLEGIFIFLMVIMTIVTVAYLLGAMYHDRKDRSVLFWKSMPVSEWQDVMTKMTVAAVLIPAITVVVAFITQLAYIALAMLLVWRLDMSPVAAIWDNVELLRVFSRQSTAVLASALWFSPFYAWLLLASAAAKRSPFMLAIAPVLAVVILEEFFIGTEYIGELVASHLPTIVVDGQASHYTYGPSWTLSNAVEMVTSIAVAGGLLSAVVWLRRTRFEL
jgi:hypothetical protein